MSPLEFKGDFYEVGRKVAIRPTPNREKIHFYGAVGSKESAVGNADMGMPILLNTQFPPHMLKKVTTGWQAESR